MQRHGHFVDARAQLAQLARGDPHGLVDRFLEFAAERLAQNTDPQARDAVADRTEIIGARRQHPLARIGSSSPAMTSSSNALSSTVLVIGPR